MSVVKPVYIVPPPELRTRTEAIAAKLARNGIGCSHLEKHPIAVVCWQHPAIVRCGNCHDRHVGSHSHDDEHRCDQCRGPLDGPDGTGAHLSLMHRIVVDCTVGIGRGRRAAIGVVIVSGWGACPSCSSAIDVVEVVR